MVVIAVMVIAGVVLATVWVTLLLRDWGRSVARTESELREPGTRTITYDVPVGRDPVDYATALHRSGYTVVSDGPGRLLIGCPRADDPERVRRLLEQA